MDRHWLLTWTTYGTWLPGDERGFVSNVRDGTGPEVRHNRPGTEPDRNMPGLRKHAERQLDGPPVKLKPDHAPVLLTQFRTTAEFRGWQLLAAAVMANHIHLVTGVPGDPQPDSLLRDFKSYAGRALNRQFTKPASGTWWTESGSRRRLRDPQAVLNAIRYLVQQEYPLLIWTALIPELNLPEGIHEWP